MSSHSFKGGHPNRESWMPYKIKNYLENHRDIKKGGEENLYGFHPAIIVYLCALIVHSTGKNNNNQ